jgi:lipopolysaccharide export LptBFGC system permease protein LptF
VATEALNLRAPGLSGRLGLTLVIALAAWVSFSLAGVAVEDGFHPITLLASLIPLQLAALLWALSRRRPTL